MKNNASHRANKGSNLTESQTRSVNAAASGSNRKLKIKARTGSREGFQHAPRADITSKGTGYLAKSAQKARVANKRVPMDQVSLAPPAFLPKANPTALSVIGMRATGASRILQDRMELNNI
jgi:hypothetical protein